MKKAFVSLVLLCSTALCSAQPEAGSVSIQPKLGINIANITHGQGSDPRVGVVGGIEIQNQVSQYLGLSYGILYSMQGAKQEASGVTATLKTDYLNVPILANVYLYKGLALKAGIQPGFNVVDKYKAASGGRSVTTGLSDIGITMKSFDFGIPFGISFEHKNVVFDARYILGLTKFDEDEDDDSRHRVIQITLGYRFNR
ncbi:MAG: PorT family protein [Bacteroidaceae bacterium]|nr:PorT family protein [Bacteroidaceae bacterium]